MGHAAYRQKAPDVYFPKKISLHRSEFGGKSYGSRKSGRVSCFSRAFPAKIPVNRGMLPANREFHVVAGVVIFPTHPGPRINLLPMSDFDELSIVGKLALPTFARFQIRGNPSLGL